MDNNKSGLRENEDVLKPETTNFLSAEKIKKSRAKQNSVNEFKSKILESNITFLSSSITLVEITNANK